MLKFAVQKKRIMKFLKGTKIYSVLTGTCPVCQIGKMYKNPNAFNMVDAFKMHEHCSNCGLKFKMEPSFFFGAMYVSYGVGAAIAIASFLVTHLLFDMSRFGSFLAIVVALIVLMPYIIRISRNIWINVFLQYDSKKAE